MDQPRAHLAALLWPDSSEAQARTNLRKRLHELRRALPDAERFLDLRAQTVSWRAGAPYRLDVAEFEAAARRAGTPAEIAGALRLYRGDLLPGHYDEWILGERERLRQAVARLLERGIAAGAAERDYPTALGYARRLRDHDPLHEAAHRALIRLHALAGDRVAAVRAYHDCAAVLQRELGIAPSRETRDLYERVLASRPLPPAPK
jgi:DNA-binding SARP family transcriptional activator